MENGLWQWLCTSLYKLPASPACSAQSNFSGMQLTEEEALC